MAISTNLVIILGMMQVSKRVPFDDPFVLNIVRSVYMASNIIIICLYAYVQLVINRKKGMKRFSIRNSNALIILTPR